MKQNSERVTLEERFRIMREFMNRHFPTIIATFSIRHQKFAGPLQKPDNNFGVVLRGA